MLRNYQREMLDRLMEAWRLHRSVMVQMPTGTGKTLVMAHAIRSVSQPVLIVAHRRELIEQIKETVAGMGLPETLVHVESIQKISKAKSDDHYSLIIVDEAHHALAKTYRQLWEWWPEAKFLGLTATPCRLNGAAFTDLFDVLLQSYDIQRFIDEGWLSDFEYVSASPDSLALQQVGALRKRGADGDYQTKEMVTVMDVPQSIMHLYDTYHEFASGRKGIVYAIDRQHAGHIADYYQGQGVNCCVIDAKTPAQERKRLVEDYREGRVDVIVNVDIFSEGFDCPEVEFIQLARPTLSLSKYLQQVGRGMRVSKGKEAVLILDQVGLYQTFGLPTDNRDWRLTFLGKKAGKGGREGEMPIIVREDSDDRMLVNLEMVRIKRRNERHEGLEVFMQGGKYGIMNNGNIMCQAAFVSVMRVEGSHVYALATYPYEIFRSKTTAIGTNGQDLRVALYGKVVQEGDFLEGIGMNGEKLYWDTKGRRYYKRKPQFEEIADVEMYKEGNGYVLRQETPFQKVPMRKEDIFFNRCITWMKDLLIVKGETDKVYQILGYGEGTFYVNSHNAGYVPDLMLGLDGQSQEVRRSSSIFRMAQSPQWGYARLRRASTGEYEYMDKTWVGNREALRRLAK